MTQPRGRKIDGGIAVEEGTDHNGASSDLAHDALERMVAPDASPVLLGKLIVRQGLRKGRLDQLGLLSSFILWSRATTSPALLRAAARPSSA